MEGEDANWAERDAAERNLVSAFLHDARMPVAVPMSSGSIRLWRFNGTEPEQILLETPEGGSSPTIALSPDGHHLAAATGFNYARLWTVRHGAPHSVILPGQSQQHLSAMAFSPDSRSLATAWWDGSIRFWTLGGAQPAPRDLRWTGLGVIMMAFSPDGTRLLATSHDGTTRIWRTGNLDAEPISLDHVLTRQARFSADGRRVITMSESGEARIWKLGDRTSVLLERPDSQVRFPASRTIRDAAFSPDGQRVAIVYGDRTIGVWAIDGNNATLLELTASNVPVALTSEFLLQPEPTQVAFSDDGYNVVVRFNDGTVRAWYLPSGTALRQLAQAEITRCLTDAQSEIVGLPLRGVTRRDSVTAPPC